MQMPNRLQGKRVVLTSSNDFMGQATQEVFAEEGAEIIADTSDLTKPDAADALIKSAGQVGYVQSVGVEVGPHNIQINLIAQNYVQSEEYYPASLLAKESFQQSLKRQVPAGRLGTPREDALFAAFLASNESDFFIGQAIPFSGGWAQR